MMRYETKGCKFSSIFLALCLLCGMTFGCKSLFFKEKEPEEGPKTPRYQSKAKIPANAIILENFDKYDRSIFDKWVMRDRTREEALRDYTVKTEEGNKYLHALSDKTSVQIAKIISWDVMSYPYLRWRWRVHILPRGANEEIGAKNDSAAAVYVVFPRQKIPFLSWDKQPINVIKYVWSSSLPAGKVVSKKVDRMGMIIYEGKFIVLESGAKKKGQWIEEKRNVFKDYLKYFGEPPKFNPSLIAILTDSNNTGTKAEADYDDLLVHQVEP